MFNPETPAEVKCSQAVQEEWSFCLGWPQRKYISSQEMEWEALPFVRWNCASGTSGRRSILSCLSVCVCKLTQMSIIFSSPLPILAGLWFGRCKYWETFRIKREEFSHCASMHERGQTDLSVCLPTSSLVLDRKCQNLNLNQVLKQRH